MDRGQGRGRKERGGERKGREGGEGEERGEVSGAGPLYAKACIRPCGRHVLRGVGDMPF